MLNVTDLVLAYDGAPVLHLPSLNVAPAGEHLLLGPSGSGKTTLLYAVAGLLRPLSGRILLQETDVTALKDAERDRFRARQIGLIFQSHHLVRSLNVWDNLLLAAYAAGLPQDKARAITLLERLGVADKRDALPYQLSQGQAQRVAIARAVFNRPALLLADEPTASLDDANALNAANLLREAAKETGAMLLLSTHDARLKPLFSEVTHLGSAA